jgi:hypothetical protein
MISSTVSVSSSEAILPENLPDASQAPNHVRVIEGENLIAYARPLYTSLDDPSNHIVPTSNPHDGVAELILTRTDGTFGCSGTLADDKIHVFTAAHCVADDNGNYILTSGSATFEGNSQSITIPIDTSNSVSHPDFDGDYIKGNDIAILKLVSSPPGVPGIPHATSGSAVGSVVDKSGYGLSGYFNSGTDRSNYPFGTQRDGQNKYDAFADTMYSALGLTSGVDFVPQAVYQFDSDDGNSSHDAFGFFFGISDIGLGNNEVMSASGDSGGPTILNGELVGVTSYGITLQYINKQTSDCTKQRGSPSLDSSCGEFAGDTRVSQYSDFIASILNPINDTDPPVISAINVDASTTTATITWTTNEAAASLVDYGTDDTYGLSVSDSNYVTSHSIELTGLSSSTDYHFMITSEDASTNSASSSDAHFTTTSPPTLVSISISPDNPSITEGSTQQFTVTGTYSDDTNQVLAADTWESSDGNVATIDADGLASSGIAGSTTIKAIYGALEDTTTLAVTSAPEEPTTASVSSINYIEYGGKDNSKHLDITITIIDNFDAPVSGASISIDLDRDGSFITSWTASTATDGTVTFSLKNAASGFYETDVTGVIAGSLTFVDDYVDLGFDKY